MTDTENHNFIPEDLSNYKVVREGDLVINKMKAWQGSLGLAPTDGIVSPAYFVFRFDIENIRYGQALLRSRPYVSFFARVSDGVRIGQWDLSIDGMKRIPVVLPPPDEQAAIDRFLVHVDRQLVEFIRTKQEMLALLEEQRRVVIRQVVTKGLNPAIGLKPSGVPWLGEIPLHWNVSRVKNEFECLNKRRIPLSSTERSLMKQRKYDYYGASGAIDRVDDYLFDGDLLLIAEDGANLVLRNLPLAIIARGKFWVNNHAHILKPKRGNLNYLSGLMESFSYTPWITGAAQPKLTQDRLMAIQIAVPPQSEQDKMADHLIEATASIDLLADRARREVALLREFRVRLIADVVTGKRDVRAAASVMPAEPIDAQEAIDLLSDSSEMEPDETEEAIS